MLHKKVATRIFNHRFLEHWSIQSGFTKVKTRISNLHNTFATIIIFASVDLRNRIPILSLHNHGNLRFKLVKLKTWQKTIPHCRPKNTRKRVATISGFFSFHLRQTKTEDGWFPWELSTAGMNKKWEFQKWLIPLQISTRNNVRKLVCHCWKLNRRLLHEKKRLAGFKIHKNLDKNDFSITVSWSVSAQGGFMKVKTRNQNSPNHLCNQKLIRQCGLKKQKSHSVMTITVFSDLRESQRKNIPLFSV